jgi:hypothetical protein
MAFGVNALAVAAYATTRVSTCVVAFAAGGCVNCALIFKVKGFWAQNPGVKWVRRLYAFKLLYRSMPAVSHDGMN